MKYKTGFVAIIGRPNSGKSTLLNSLIGEKVSIISPKPQTTRNVLRGIYTDDQSQVIFVDTPGIYKAVNKLGEIMVKNAEETFGSTDVIIYIVDASRKDLPGGEDHITYLLKNTKKPVILALNKIDKLPSKAVILKIIDELSKKVDFTEVISFKEKTKPDIVEISVNIYCEKKSHKSIIIGKNGAMLKKIGTQARIEIEGILGIKVFLELWVKVRDEWRNDIPFLKGMGFDLKGK